MQFFLSLSLKLYRLDVKEIEKISEGKLVFSITSTMNCILEIIYLIDHLACTAPCGSAALLLNM